jgi:hypothetical protein
MPHYASLLINMGMLYGKQGKREKVGDITLKSATTLNHTLDGFVGTLFIYNSKPCEQQDYPNDSEYQVYPFDPIRSSFGFPTQNSP